MKAAYRRMEGAAALLLWCLVVLTSAGRHVASVSDTPEVCSSPLQALLLLFLSFRVRHAVMPLCTFTPSLPPTRSSYNLFRSSQCFYPSWLKRRSCCRLSGFLVLQQMLLFVSEVKYEALGLWLTCLKMLQCVSI